MSTFLDRIGAAHDRLSTYLSPEQIAHIHRNAAAIFSAETELPAALEAIADRLDSGETFAEICAGASTHGPPDRRRLQFDFTLSAAEGLDALVVALKAKDRAEVVRIALRDLDNKVNREPGKAVQEARLALAAPWNSRTDLVRILEALVAYAAASEEGLLRIVRALRPCFNPIPGAALDAPRLADTIASMLEGIVASFNDRSRVLSHVQVPELRRAAEKALGPDRVEDFLRQIFDVAAHDRTGR